MLQTAVPFEYEMLPCMPVEAAGKNWMPWQLDDCAQTIMLRSHLGQVSIQDIYLAACIETGRYSGRDEHGYCVGNADEWYISRRYAFSRGFEIALAEASKGISGALERVIDLLR